MSRTESYWNSPFELLFRGKKLSKTGLVLKNAGIEKVRDLLWVLPLRVEILPEVSRFEHASEGSWFRGAGKVLNVTSRPSGGGKPAFGRFKKNVSLSNISVMVQDLLSDQTISLKWFNAYPSTMTKLEGIDEIHFLGKVSQYGFQKQIVNPELEAETSLSTGPSLKVVYPTIGGTPGHQIKKVIDKIPLSRWREIPETTPADILNERGMLPLSESFLTIHGKNPEILADDTIKSMAEKRLIYEEFFQEQLKVLARRKNAKAPEANILMVDDIRFQAAMMDFPYSLTPDQEKTCRDIRTDLASGHPMMRLVQGDVGCGKTSIAVVASRIANSAGYQTAFMVPTEALALQHFMNITSEEKTMKTELLLGSTKPADKKRILESLENGQTDLVIGTHALIQESVNFRKLGLAIIDEQHKFGVNQRIKLTSKGEGVHTLIMTATPIPRSLRLTQYGDLDISTIKTLPLGRKGHKTRIVQPDQFELFLNFANTRMEMGEQVYVVVPAIQENPEMDMLNVETVFEKFSSIFKNRRVKALHGRMKAEEKEEIFRDFSSHKIDLLISTSVVEVGINVLNATVMAIMNPERFGLSSLHQLRGRVGRGEKPGFCFLVADKKLSPEALGRLQVIENNTDGFIIAEEDLKFRGEGNLFGTEQSGKQLLRKLANPITHHDLLDMARNDISRLNSDNNPQLNTLLALAMDDLRVTTTI